MPVVRFYEDATVAVLPGMVDMGSAFAGRRCNIIRAMARTGGITEKGLSERIGVNQAYIHDAVLKMEKEGTVFMMSPRGARCCS